MPNNDMSHELLLTDCLIRINVLEQIIINAGLVSKEKLNEDVLSLSSKIAEEIIKKVKSSDAVPNK